MWRKLPLEHDAIELPEVLLEKSEVGVLDLRK